jgi:hypothetical protein
MTYPNTLLGRCTVAHQEELSGLPDHRVAAVFEHLAAEILYLQELDPQLTLRQFSRNLLEEAAAVEGRE